MLGFTKIRGFYQETFVSLKTNLSEKSMKVLEYGAAPRLKIFYSKKGT